MVKIEKIAWAKVTIAGQDYWQVLIIDHRVIPREVANIKKTYGTDHVIAEEEQILLLSKNPEVILIANGWSGILKVDDDFKKKVTDLKIDLKIVFTPKIKKIYNQLMEKGKRVNALIHTTC
jgi:hypothetical protein